MIVISITIPIHPISILILARGTLQITKQRHLDVFRVWGEGTIGDAIDRRKDTPFHALKINRILSGIWYLSVFATTFIGLTSLLGIRLQSLWVHGRQLWQELLLVCSVARSPLIVLFPLLAALILIISNWSDYGWSRLRILGCVVWIRALIAVIKVVAHRTLVLCKLIAAGIIVRPLLDLLDLWGSIAIVGNVVALDGLVDARAPATGSRYELELSFLRSHRDLLRGPWSRFGLWARPLEEV